MNNKNRTYNSAKNMTLAFAEKFLSMIINFIGRAVFVRVLAEEYLGINGLFTDVFMMLSLADLGLGTAMAYSFYRPLAENNQKKISALVTFYRKLYNYIALSVAIIGLAIVPLLDYIVKTDNPIPHLKIYYLISLVNIVLSYLFIYKASIITADQRGYEISKYGIWINVLKLIFQTIILYITHSYLCFILVRIVVTVSNNVLITFKANKMYPFIKQKIELELSEKKEIFNNIKSVFIYKVSRVLLSGTDNILISIIIGTVIVGKYSNYNMIVTSLSSIASIIFGSLTASLGNLIVKENSKKRYEIFEVMQMVSFWLCGAFVVCVYFLSEDFILIWVGKNYLLDHMALIAIELNFYLGLSLIPIWTFREATGLYMKTKYIMLITAGINLLCSVILGNMLGLSGIIVATFISKISTYFWYEPSILFHDFFEQNVLYYYIGHIKNIIITFLGGVLIYLLLNDFSVFSYKDWIFKAGFCFIIINIVYFIRYFRTKEFKIIFGKLKHIL